MSEQVELSSEGILVDALTRIHEALKMMQKSEFAGAHTLLNESSSLVSILEARGFVRKKGGNWQCPRCGQVNSDWANECGRCNTKRRTQ